MTSTASVVRKQIVVGAPTAKAFSVLSDRAEGPDRTMVELDAPQRRTPRPGPGKSARRSRRGRWTPLNLDRYAALLDV